MDVVDKMRVAMPQDLRDAEAILEKRDMILEQVLGEARSVKQAAEEESSRLIEEGTINIEVNKQVEKLFVDAQERAQKLLEEAEAEAAERRSGADSYIHESLLKLETEMAAILDRIRRGMDILKV
jgi:hypothetical protein